MAFSGRRPSHPTPSRSSRLRVRPSPTSTVPKPYIPPLCLTCAPKPDKISDILRVSVVMICRTAGEGKTAERSTSPKGASPCARVSPGAGRRHEGTGQANRPLVAAQHRRFSERAFPDGRPPGGKSSLPPGPSLFTLLPSLFSAPSRSKIAGCSRSTRSTVWPTIVAPDGLITLREALEAANTNTACLRRPGRQFNRIRPDHHLRPRRRATVALPSVAANSKSSTTLTSTARVPDLLTIDADGQSRVFYVAEGR